MRRRIVDHLYVGDLRDCKAVRSGPWSIVHACKNPCHAEKCGQRPDKNHADYLWRQEGHELYLNMIDPPTPLFPRLLFDQFLRFAQAEWTAGRRLLIHCNHGESRAPTLALLFLAKSLYKVSNASYDDAWDDFQKIIGEDTYAPGQGIEEWMRAHWHEIEAGARLPVMFDMPELPVPEPEPEVELKLPTDTESAAELFRNSPLFHFSGCTQIETKNHKWEVPDPNKLQFAIAEAYQYCVDNNIKCRLIILKPRQVGCSTFCAELCYHHMRRYPSDMLVMGDVSKRVEKVYEMFNDFSTHDSFSTFWDSIYRFNTEKGIFRYADGSQGLVEHDTALDPKAGISATRQVLWLTEAARYLKKNGRDKKVITAVLNSLANGAQSLGIAESTADGAAGWYYETWQGAATVDDLKTGRVDGWNGWIKVFAAWFEFPEHKLDRKPENVEYFKEELDDRERRGIAIYGWNAEQIAWRRMKIKQDCANDPRMFDQDFPEDPESCFLASGRPRFDMTMLTKYEQKAKIGHQLARTGSLEREDMGLVDPLDVLGRTKERMGYGKVSFLDRKDGEAWLWMREDRIPGCQYIIGGDPCTGAQAEGSPFPDSHGIVCVRASYRDERGTFQPPRVVAVIDVPNGCRWDDPIAAARTVRMADYYGGCLIVPETGNGLGFLNELQHLGAYIFRREKMNAMRPGEKLKVAGWHTDESTRPLWVNAVGEYLMQIGLDCDYLPLIKELRTFIINDRGKAEAKSGCHDDLITGLGLALYNIAQATTYVPPLMRFGSDMGSRGGGICASIGTHATS